MNQLLYGIRDNFRLYLRVVSVFFEYLSYSVKVFALMDMMIKQCVEAGATSRATSAQ